MRNAIWSFDEGTLKEDLLAAVIRGVPEDHDAFEGMVVGMVGYRESLKVEFPNYNDVSIDGKLKRSIDPPSNFIYALRNIPQCRKRLEYWMFTNDFNSTVASLKISVTSVTRMIKTVRNSEGLRDIFTMLRHMLILYDHKNPEKYEKGFPLNMLFAVTKRQINGKMIFHVYMPGKML